MYVFLLMIVICVCLVYLMCVKVWWCSGWVKVSSGVMKVFGCCCW